MSLKDLFADELGQPVPKSKKTDRPKSLQHNADDRSLEGWARVILNHGREQRATTPAPFTVQKLGHEGVTDSEARMEEYDKQLFEGLFLRYGRKWILAQMALLLRRFPSYRKDD